MISIILPVHNTAKFLPSCLDSILNQTYDDWELIAVENGSTDNSLTVLNEYRERDKRVRVFHLADADLLDALRLGYSKSTGELIHRMDSDDKMPLYKLQTMFDTWSLHGKGNVITGPTKYFVDEGEVGSGFKRYDSWLMNVARENSYESNKYKECVIPSNCWLVHRDDFEKIEAFNPSIYPEDYDLCFRFLKDLSIIGLHDILHHWRDRPDRISRNWECYKDNRFLSLKVNYFFQIDRISNRPLVLWGAGKNGKDIAKLILDKKSNFEWVCDNQNKIGKDIYNVKMKHFHSIEKLTKAQLIIAVASPQDQLEVKSYLNNLNKKEGIDYWFFS